MRWRDAAALIFLLALTVGLYWRLTFTHDYTWLENPDQGLQVRPWFDYEARELHAGRIPLWDPYLWGGQTLIGQVQPGLANPLNWILFAMPLRDGHIPVDTLHWYWVLIHWLAAAFTFWLCRDLDCGIVASLLGGSIFAFMGFMGHSFTPQFLMSALWIPVVLLFFARVFRGHRPWSSAALCGVAMGLAFLSGHHNIPVYTAVLMMPLWLWYLLGSRRQIVQRAAHAAVFVAIWLLVSAVQSMPATEYGHESVRWSGVPEPQRWQDKLPYSVHAEYSLFAKSIPGMVVPGIKVHADPFVGIGAMTLAIAGLILGRRSRTVRLFGVVALGGLLLALGKDTPVHRLAYDWIPLVEKARYPAMAVVLCQAGIAVLAALGLEAWFRAKHRAVALCLLPVFAACVGAVYYRHWYPLEKSALGVAAVAVVLALVLYLLRGKALGRAVVFALFLVEALLWPEVFDRRDRPNSYAGMMASQADIADFLKRQPGWFRVDADEDVVPYNFGDWFGIEQFGGYVASMPARIHHVNGRLETPGQFGIRYRIARTPPRPEQIPVFESRSGLKVFEDPRIADPLHVVRDAPCGNDRLRIVSRVSNAFVVDTDLACAGLVVAGDPWFQGWRAWVDGRRVRIRDFEGVIRAVPVEAGQHTVEFRYRPGSVYWGAALTALGLCAASMIWALERRKRG
jgi:hypothetical protein